LTPKQYLNGLNVEIARGEKPNGTPSTTSTTTHGLTAAAHVTIHAVAALGPNSARAGHSVVPGNNDNAATFAAICSIAPTAIVAARRCARTWMDKDEADKLIFCCRSSVSKFRAKRVLHTTGRRS
jgi:hypothetical protein